MSCTIMVVEGFAVANFPTNKAAFSTGTSRVVLHSTQENSTQQQQEIPSIVSSPVLKQVYPDLMAHVEEYGHPNIPLGTSQGRLCQTLRKLHIQQKLTPDEVGLLENLQFRFHSLEDVYHEVDFENLFQRLLQYEAEYKTGFQVPKKFQPDPELGAWVTGIRRLGPNKIKSQHASLLNELGFAWKSNRICGSQFMKQYREIQTLSKENPAVLQDESVQSWLKAQGEAYKRGSLSETRFHYMAQLFGNDWNK